MAGKNTKKASSKWGKGKTDPATHWKKGCKSPNLKGRPKGSKNQKTLHKEAVGKKMKVTLDGETKSMTAQQLAYHQLAQQAAGGDLKTIGMQMALDEKFDPVETTPPSLLLTLRSLRNWLGFLRSSRFSRRRKATMADPFELRAIVDELSRRDFRAFAIRAFPVLEPGLLEPAPHIHIICRLLEMVYDGDVRRALVCIPPRYLKTYLISIAYTAWLLGKDPKTRIICASYGGQLAEKFSSDTRKLMKSAWYRRTFPGRHSSY